MTKVQQQLEETIAQLQKELAAANATIEQLKASKTTKTKATKQAKIRERSETKVQNSDYIGRILTLHTHQEVLATMSMLTTFTDLPIYVKVSGAVSVNGEHNSFPKLVPVTVNQDGAFTILNTDKTVTPINDTWDVAWIVAMRPAAAKRYFEGIKPEKKTK